MINNEKKTRDYSDIIDMPHHVSRTRPHMSMHDRAAQFAPFAALTGYEELIEEAGDKNATKEDIVTLSSEYTDIP